MEDVREIGQRTIDAHLPRLVLPDRICRFWGLVSEPTGCQGGATDLLTSLQRRLLHETGKPPALASFYSHDRYEGGLDIVPTRLEKSLGPGHLLDRAKRIWYNVFDV